MNRALFFYDNGVQPFPTKDGAHAKEPACKWTVYSASRERVARFKNYGVRLGAFTRNGCPSWLAVLDTDSDAAENWIRARIAAGEIPKTPLTVTTGRYGGGTHRYFRLDKPAPKFIQRDGLIIEFRNVGQYVVGPGSVHPSGNVYTAAPWSWDFDEVPFFPSEFVFDDGSCRRISSEGRLSTTEYEFPDEVFEPNRHNELFKLLRSFKGLGADLDTCREIVRLANENRCKPPLTDRQFDPRGGFDAWTRRVFNQPDRPLVRPEPLSVNWEVF
jgi:hypothetical protein